MTPTAAAPRQATLRVTARETVADGVVALTLADPAGARLPDWTPGSHVDLVLPTGLTRQYSLCGDRWDASTYRVAVLREPIGRGGSAWVHDELAVGDLVGVGGPRNQFRLVPAPRYLFIAGGIGITPLLPMIDAARRLGADWRLVYGGRTRDSMAFLDELAVHGDRVTVLPQDEHGHLPLAELFAGGDADTRVYCCGPAPLLDAVAGLDLPPRVLRTERFAAQEQGAPARDTPFTVVLDRTGVEVVVTPDVSVLEAVRSVGVDVLSSCREGTCGTCETTVLAGEPDHRDSVLDEAERAAGDCLFVCVSRSRGDRLVLDL
ncbi:ferredoxin [Geodermatophilus sp. Leaf369]|uniref:PDR/VanB family oxidoreductase n=1 Tax=Geodermatophilus sp. Leaf369 TaxID=1736354 RepID=UPI0006FBAC35|nr:PDR/VanB family oxidoreductase [Geodermatophilus sp. Leaf369]KQS61122.1 ferredoxin [Geodermatophilus sp. Leaf369]